MNQWDIVKLVRDSKEDGGIRIGDPIYLLRRDMIHGKPYKCVECGKVMSYCRLHPSYNDVGDFYNVTVKVEDIFGIYDLNETRVLFASKSEDEVRERLLNDE